MKSYVSIHDVSPKNLDKIENIIFILNNKFNINKFCILVIPGLKWNKYQIKKLKKWQNDGIEIAAHGWKHSSKLDKSLYHKIHSLMISKNCAEHLSKNKNDIINLIQKSYNWFISNGFKKPKLYVPPAWALGNINKNDINKLNFLYYECTTGLIHNKKYYFLPLIGFEEKFLIRGIVRKIFNSLNYFMASFTGVIRIAIHPNDFHLYLKNDIKKYLSKNNETILLHELS